MRKLNLLFKSLFLLCALIVGSSAWAGDVTVTFSSNTDVGTGNSASGNNSVSKEGISINCTAGGFAINGGAHYRLGLNSTTTISSSVGNIKSIVINGPSGTGQYSISKVGENEGWTLDSENGTYSWSGNSASVSVNVKEAQVRPTSIEVKYTPSTTPTISFDATLKIISVGGKITQLAKTTNTGENIVSYSSNSTSVATVNSTTGEVTGVAAGTATITASVTVGGVLYSTSYYVQVINIADGSFDFTNGFDYGSGLESSQTQRAANVPYVFTAGNITITTAGTGNFLWDADLRLYANSSMTISAPDGYVITQIAFTGSNMKKGTIEGAAFENDTENTWKGKKQSVTVARGSGTIAFNTIVVSYEEKGNNETATASIDATNIFASGGNPTSANITTNPAGLAVTYSSSKNSVATVSNTGVVTPVAAGKVTITASWEEQVVGSTTYDAGSQNFEVTVYQMVDGVFDFESGVFDYGSGITPTSESSHYETTESTWTSGNVTMVASGKYRWWNSDKTLRFYVDDHSAMTFSVPSGYVITKIVLTGGQTFTADGYNAGTWKGAQQSVTLSYKAATGSVNVKSATVYYSTPTFNLTMDEAGYMTYCNQNAALSFGDLEAYVVSAVGENSVTLTQITKAPANTPVILKGAAGNHTITVEASADAVETNKLYRSNGTAKNTNTRNVYALANKDKGIGFYKLGNDVTVPEGKCYISVATDNQQAPSAREFLSLGDDATGIKTVEGVTEHGVVYDLQGRRVSKPSRGLYIENGKKIMIK